MGRVTGRFSGGIDNLTPASRKAGVRRNGLVAATAGAKTFHASAAFSRACAHR
jgi:hypothetical protein